jgi:hypothetical protein
LALLSIERVRDGVRLVALEESCIRSFSQDYMSLRVFSTKDFSESTSKPKSLPKGFFVLVLLLVLLLEMASV